MEKHHEPREWKLRSDLPTCESELSERVASLQKATGLSPITLRVCLSRGLRTPEAIQEYLNPRLDSLKNPFSIRDMDRAIDRLAALRAQDQSVRVFGDYDVDGTTGAALLSWVLREHGIKHDARQPDRFKDGYGLNVRAVEEAYEAGIRVMMTVDCGITSFDAANRAAQLGVDLIIVDHHQIDPGKGLPKAHAIINPQRSDCESGLRQLCGCGLAFYVAMALRSRGRQEGWFAGGTEPNLKQHLDLVVMATAADMVPLTGDNHILVRQGMEVLKQSRKPGLRALLEAAGLNANDLSPSSLGFVLGPRINASGRMHSASLALELLTTTDASRAFKLAHELERLNEERAYHQNQIWDEVRRRVEKGLAEGKFQNGIVVADSEWHEGVVGIVASRVTETFRRPAAVIALREDLGKGSVRTYGGKDILSALRAASANLLGFGGHKHAAGLSIALDQVEAFAQAFDQALGQIEEDLTTKPLLVEGDCTIDDLDVRTLQEIEKLGPFGPGNPEPIFTFRASVRNHQILKGRHLKLNLGPVGSEVSGRMIEAIWFNAASHKDVVDGSLLSAEDAEWAGVPELNRFRGRMTPTLRVRDWRRPQ